MRKRSTRIHSRGSAYSQMVAIYAYIQDSTKWMDWTVSRRVSLRQGWLGVQAGNYEAVTRKVGDAVQLVGFRALKPTFSGGQSPASLTDDTMGAVGAAVYGDGRADLSRRERAEVLKFRVWPLIGDTKAVRVAPKMTEGERGYAEKLLRQGYARMAKAA